jgi:hypothetical protein
VQTEDVHEQKLPTAAQAIKPHRKRHGKIAKLPRQVRLKINRMLDDGHPHAEIIAALGEHGKGINKYNLINWEKGGYQEWLKDLPWLEQLQSRLDFAHDVMADPDSPKVREASLVIAVKQMYELITTFEPASFKEKLAEEPATYSRVINSLAKLAEIGLRYDQQHTEAARLTTKEKDMASKATGLSKDGLMQFESEYRLLRRRRQAEPTESANEQVRSGEVSDDGEGSAGEVK